jgi:hypothetical protein
MRMSVYEETGASYHTRTEDLNLSERIACDSLEWRSGVAQRAEPDDVCLRSKQGIT